MSRTERELAADIGRVGELRDALAGLGENTPIVVQFAENGLPGDRPTTGTIGRIYSVVLLEETREVILRGKRY
jgi:hypothetical protein